MMRPRSVVCTGLLALGVSLLAACGDEATQPSSPPASSGQLFYEPLSFCFVAAEDTKTLTVFNQGDDELTWTPLSVPAGSQGLADTLTLAPRSFTDLLWTWSPQGSYPILDSLVVSTSDAEWPRVTVLARREDPVGAPDNLPPDAPILAVPADGAVFQLVVVDTVLGKKEVEIQLAWSEIDDCSGIQFYDLDISLTPDFTQIVCCDPPPVIDTASAVVVAVEGDQGVAYWRVTAVDGAGLRGLPSQPRSWTVVD